MSAKRAVDWLRQVWSNVVDPTRDERLESFTELVYKEFAKQKHDFSFVVTADRLEIADADRLEVTRRLFTKFVKKYWLDGELTENEQRNLHWVANKVGFSDEDANKILLEFAGRYFAMTLAHAFEDGILDDHEFTLLENIAKSCGMTASDFFRTQFREHSEGFIRNLFLKVWEDGRMDESEWMCINKTICRLGLTEREFQAVVQSPARQLVEHSLADFKSDGEVVDDENKTLEWMLKHLISDKKFAEYVRREVKQINMIARARRGELPSCDPPRQVAIRAGEIVHYHSPTTFVYERKRKNGLIVEKVDGVTTLTDDRLIFTSPESSHAVIHKSVLGYIPYTNAIEIQVSGKGAGTYFFESSPEIAVEFWIAAVAKANQTLIAPQVKNDARKISRDVRQRVWQKYGGQCAECSATNYLEFDHIIPVARGGGNSENNIQLLCRGCNSKKSDAI